MVVWVGFGVVPSRSFDSGFDQLSHHNHILHKIVHQGPLIYKILVLIRQSVSIHLNLQLNQNNNIWIFYAPKKLAVTMGCYFELFSQENKSSKISNDVEIESRDIK